jgi:hypothetical protein
MANKTTKQALWLTAVLALIANIFSVFVFNDVGETDFKVSDDAAKRTFAILSVAIDVALVGLLTCGAILLFQHSNATSNIWWSLGGAALIGLAIRFTINISKLWKSI